VVNNELKGKGQGSGRGPTEILDCDLPTGTEKNHEKIC
jgi:hypothetical protein